MKKTLFIVLIFSLFSFLGSITYSYAMTWDQNYHGSETGSYNDWCCKSGYPCEKYSYNNGTIEFRFFSNDDCKMGTWGCVYVYYTPTQSYKADMNVTFHTQDCSMGCYTYDSWSNISQKVIVYHPNGTIVKSKIRQTSFSRGKSFSSCGTEISEDLFAIPLTANLRYKLEVCIVGEGGNGGSIFGFGSGPFFSLATFSIRSIYISEPPHPNSCEDSDGGENFKVKGKVSGYFNNQPYQYIDTCVNLGTYDIKEYFCTGNYYGFVQDKCDRLYGSGYHCYEGRCTYTSNWGGGCPTLFVYDGKEYQKVRKSNLHSQKGIDTVDDIVIDKLTEVNGNYLLQLKETTLPEHSYIDSVKLYAVDKDGMKELKLISAKHSRLEDVTSILSNSDDVRTNTEVFDSIELKFEAANADYYLFEIEGYNPRSSGFYKMDIAQLSIIAIVVSVGIIAAVFVVFKLFAKKK